MTAADIELLARYNAEISRGVAHTDSWIDKMKLLQAQYNLENYGAIVHLKKDARSFERLCKCPDWAENTVKINNIIGMHQIRTGQSYDGKRFSFCPFCGSELLFVLDEFQFERPPVEAGEEQS